MELKDKILADLVSGGFAYQPDETTRYNWTKTGRKKYGGEWPNHPENYAADLAERITDIYGPLASVGVPRDFGTAEVRILDMPETLAKMERDYREYMEKRTSVGIRPDPISGWTVTLSGKEFHSDDLQKAATIIRDHLNILAGPESKPEFINGSVIAAVFQTGDEQYCYRTRDVTVYTDRKSAFKYLRQSCDAEDGRAVLSLYLAANNSDIIFDEPGREIEQHTMHGTLQLLTKWIAERVHNSHVRKHLASIILASAALTLDDLPAAILKYGKDGYSFWNGKEESEHFDSLEETAALLSKHLWATYHVAPDGQLRDRVFSLYRLNNGDFTLHGSSNIPDGFSESGPLRKLLPTLRVMITNLQLDATQRRQFANYMAGLPDDYREHAILYSTGENYFARLRGQNMTERGSAFRPTSEWLINQLADAANFAVKLAHGDDPDPFGEAGATIGDPDEFNENGGLIAGVFSLKDGAYELRGSTVGAERINSVMFTEVLRGLQRWLKHYDLDTTGAGLFTPPTRPTPPAVTMADPFGPLDLKDFNGVREVHSVFGEKQSAFVAIVNGENKSGPLTDFDTALSYVYRFWSGLGHRIETAPDDGSVLLVGLYQTPTGYRISGSVGPVRDYSAGEIAAGIAQGRLDHFIANLAHYPDLGSRVDMPEEREDKLVFGLYRWPDDADGAYYSFRKPGYSVMGKLATVRPEVHKALQAEDGITVGADPASNRPDDLVIAAKMYFDGRFDNGFVKPEPSPVLALYGHDERGLYWTTGPGPVEKADFSAVAKNLIRQLYEYGRKMSYHAAFGNWLEMINFYLNGKATMQLISDPVPAARQIVGLYDYGDEGKTFIVSSELPGRTGRLIYSSKEVASDRAISVIGDYKGFTAGPEIIAQLISEYNMFEISGAVKKFSTGAIYTSGDYKGRIFDACLDLVTGLSKWLDEETGDLAAGSKLGVRADQLFASARERLATDGAAAQAERPSSYADLDYLGSLRDDPEAVSLLNPNGESYTDGENPAEETEETDPEKYRDLDSSCGE